MLLAAGQPIFTDDLWWHLGLGRFFREGGLALSGDPLLFTGLGDPSTSAWLWQWGLSSLLDVAGFDGLRLLHAAFVLAILALFWSLLRRGSGSAALASFGTLIFVALAAYRLVQLRPHLFTMLALFATYRLLLEARSAPSLGRVALAAVLAAVWANVHAAFPLGLAMLAAGATGAGLASFGNAAPADERLRARWLGLALLAVFLATFLNPAGIGSYAAYFAAGLESPPLEIVYDEWQTSKLWQLPRLGGLPSPWSWLLVWVSSLGLVAVLWREFSVRGPSAAAGAEPAASETDPAGLAWALLAVFFQSIALRFLWLGAFPMLVFAQVWRARAKAPKHAVLAGGGIALSSLLALASFVQVGDWPMVSRRLPHTAAGFQRSYAVDKYFAESIWWLRDAGLRGNLYTDYTIGGFAGYWLAPQMRTLVNGSLSFPREVAGALRAIDERRGAQPGESFEALLDRLGVDLFLGVRVPEEGHPVRPWASTLAHLEATPGWIPVFRSLGSALYLRVNPKNRENLERIADFYRKQGVPFDLERGFDVGAALRQAPDWCVRNSVVPRGWSRLEHELRFGKGPRAEPARQRVATVYAVLGLYAASVELDRRALEAGATDLRTRRRLVWALARQRNFGQAKRAALELKAHPEVDSLSLRLAREVEALAELGPAEADAAVALLPLLLRGEVPWVFADVASAPVRPPRAGI